MSHSGNANKMVGETPRTDAAYFKPGATMYDLAGEMKRVERELKAANKRIKRLVEIGNKLCECASQLGWTSSPRWIERADAAVEAWEKEAKP
jgi:hypothetical protein